MADILAAPASLVLALGAVALSVLYLVCTGWLKKRGLPPGPRGWPVLGFIEFILSEKPTKLLEKVSGKYGNVFGFHVGHKYCVTLSDYASVKEGYTKSCIQSRPPKYLRTSAHKNLSELGPGDWDIHRKFFATCLKTLGVGKNRFEEIVQDELSRVMPKLERYAGKPTCNIRDIISSSISNTVLQLVCSRWFEEDHPVMINFSLYQDMSAESFCNNMAYLYFPWLDWLLNKFHPHYRAINRSMEEMKSFIRSELIARQKIHNENSSCDYIDLYLTEMKTKKHGPELFNVENLIANSLLILMGGSDTTRNTLEWLLLAMARFPEVQEKVHAEIFSVLGSEKHPAYEDKAKLPYTEATIMESQRWKTMALLNVLRMATEDTVIQGFTVPKDTVVINNLTLCHMDPNYWDKPKEFRPERFLSKDRSKTVVPESYLPFSIGKRSCPGDKMASIELFLYFTTMIQKYRLLPPKDGLRLDESHRVNRQADHPFLRVESR